jgi:hypothetical protein
MSTRVDRTPPLTGRRSGQLPIGVALGAVSIAAALPTLLAPDLLRGTAVMNGSARGTALGVLLSVAVLCAGTAMTRAAHVAGPLVVHGATWYLAYNAVMFAFATPFNELFLVYVAMLGLAAVATARSLTAGPAAGPQYRPHGRMRLTAWYIWLVVALNALAWLGRVLPATFGGDPEFLDGTGLTTNPVFVQDLGFWLPLAAFIGWLVWTGTARGGLLSGALLVFWLLESVGVAIDQGFGHAADPQSDVATLGGMWLFVGLSVVTATALVGYLRALLRTRQT